MTSANLFENVVDPIAGIARAFRRAMNWQTIEGKWDQVKGTAKQKWAKLTDDDLLAAKGGKDKFVGALKERYGMAKEEAERQIDGWLADLSPSVHKSETVSGTGKNPA